MTKADALILGNIVPLSTRNTFVEAATVKDGKIQYLGTAEWARKLCDENTKVLDYGDNYVYPGFIEAHCHGSLASQRLAFYADLKDGKSMQDYLDTMKNFVAAHPDNEFYYGAGWKLYGVPTATMLDDICADKPIVLNSIDGHCMWMNTLAMKNFDINEEAAEYWGPDIVHVDENGAPTGYISEGPVTSIMTKMSQLPMDVMKSAFLVWQDFALKLGYTAYYEAGVNEHFLKVVTELIHEGKWKLRMYCGWLIDEHAEDYVAEVHKAQEMAEKYNCEQLHILGIKIFMDGVIEAHTAWMIDDYDDTPGYTGVKRMCDHERVTALYTEAARLGFNVHAHCIGDGAARFALDCIEASQLELGNMDTRNAICHLQQIQADDVKRLASLNVVAVVAPLWMTSVDVASQAGIAYIGAKRAFYSYPQKSFLDNNGVIAFHSDFPVSSNISVPTSLHMACTRNMPDTEEFYQLNQHECISRTEALRAMTASAAYSVKQEGTMGSLEIGKIANMAVFDADFIDCPLEDFETTKWVATIIDGEEVLHA